jgi:hypothetical protein
VYYLSDASPRWRTSCHAVAATRVTCRLDGVRAAPKPKTPTPSPRRTQTGLRGAGALVVRRTVLIFYSRRHAESTPSMPGGSGSNSSGSSSRTL